MTDDEIRIKIAKLKGYIPNPKTLKEAIDCGWQQPSTGWMAGPRSISFTVNDCVTCGKSLSVEMNPPYDWKYIEDFPNYPVSIADAWELVEEMKASIEGMWFDKFSHEWELQVFIDDIPTIFPNSEFSVAACLAWLAWKEAQ